MIFGLFITTNLEFIKKNINYLLDVFNRYIKKKHDWYIFQSLFDWNTRIYMHDNTVYSFVRILI